MAWITLNYPPLLNQPVRNQVIPFRDPLNLFFQWTPRHQALSGVEYIFTLKEIYDRQVPVESAFAYSPVVYSGSQYGLSLAYTGMYPPLIEGVRYAWQIQAVVRDGFEERNLFENNGYSEIFAFDIAQNTNQPIEVDDPKDDGQQGDDEKSGDDGQQGDDGQDDGNNDEDEKPGGGVTPKEEEKPKEPERCDPPTGVSGIEEKGQLKVSWTPSKSNSNYLIAFRAKELEGSSWIATTTSRSYAYINNLRRGVLYEYRVGIRCSDGSAVYGGTYEFILPDRTEQIAAECGKIPQINFENQDPISYLNPGDIVMVGDFRMTLTEVRGGNGNFSGKGYISIPLLLEMKIAVAFNGITVNTSQQMIGGAVSTVYDASESQIGDLNEKNENENWDDLTNRVRILFELAQEEHGKGSLPDEDYHEIENYKSQYDSLSNRRQELEDKVSNLLKAMNEEQDAQEKKKKEEEVVREEDEQSQVKEEMQEAYEKIAQKMDENGYGGQVKDVNIKSSFQGVISFESSGNSFPLIYPRNGDGLPTYDKETGTFTTGETSGDYIEDSFGNYQIYFTTRGSSKIPEVDQIFSQGRPESNLCLVWLHFNASTNELGFLINYGDQFFGKELSSDIKEKVEAQFIEYLKASILSQKGSNPSESFFSSLIKSRSDFENLLTIWESFDKTSLGSEPSLVSCKQLILESLLDEIKSHPFQALTLAYNATIRMCLCMTENDRCLDKPYVIRFRNGFLHELVSLGDIQGMIEALSETGQSVGDYFSSLIKCVFKVGVTQGVNLGLEVIGLDTWNTKEAIEDYLSCYIPQGVDRQLFETLREELAAFDWSDGYFHGQATFYLAGIVAPASYVNAGKAINSLKNLKSYVKNANFDEWVEKLATRVGKGGIKVGDNIAGIKIERIKQGTNGKYIVIGRSMEIRVVPVAEQIGAEHWTGFNSMLTEAENVASNRIWIKTKLSEGYSVIDIGLDPNFVIRGDMSTGLYYSMELFEVFGIQ
jgi:hypothetical protein